MEKVELKDAFKHGFSKGYGMMTMNEMYYLDVYHRVKLWFYNLKTKLRGRLKR